MNPRIESRTRKDLTTWRSHPGGAKNCFAAPSTYKGSRLIKIFALVFPLVISHSALSQTLCFESDQNHGKVIQLRMKISPGSESALVRYRGQSKDLPLIFTSEKSNSPRNAPPPIVVTSYWSEYANGLRTGEYRLTTQGAVVGDLIYIRKKDGKKFSFSDDMNAYAVDGCDWEQ